MDTDGKNRIHEHRPTPHEGGPPKKLPYLAIALVVMFLVAIGVVWIGGDTLKRPGADPGSVNAHQAPAD